MSVLRRAFLSLLDRLHILGPMKSVYLRFRYSPGLNKISYRLNRKLVAKNSRFLKTGAPDGLPLPPVPLVFLVTGRNDLEAFYDSGVLGSRSIKDILEKNGLRIGDFRAILDFGCGCGRVMRNWRSLRDAQLHGSDYNPALIAWCRKALPFGRFEVNQNGVPLSYQDGTFDFVYAISVFTHLGEDLQDFWIAELKRVLRVGAYLMITTHGETSLHKLSREERALFTAGQIVVRGGRYAGQNICGAFHPEKYVRDRLARGFKVVDFVPEGARDAKQDAYLLLKTETLPEAGASPEEIPPARHPVD